MSLKRFTTFEGVFTPTLLSVLGVIMYLRLGWVVGEVGLGGALLIIVISNVISLTTGLSMSSIVTNIRIGHGGAYSIITKSLGMEAGGAIGIPLYLAQAISVAFYITGFSECWVAIFPGYKILDVAVVVWAVILVISVHSAKLAFRIQYFILGAIGLSLVSIFTSKAPAAVSAPFWENLSTAHFLGVFAVFFPAVTGILAGATMSGELKEPKRSIPIGTLGAIIVSIVIYSLLAFWFASRVSFQELITNTSVLIDLGRWRWAIIAGIMGATLSSALNMFVASPRTMFALGKHSIVPWSQSLATVNKRGEPRAAILFTSLIALLTLLFGTLDQVASLLTMVFLITYATINISVFIEQSIGIASFRPSFRIPKIIPFIGGVSCLAVMFLINLLFSLIALFLIAVIYYLLIKRESKAYYPDIRSGMLIFIAEKMSQVAAKLPYHPKIWKPNLLIPIIGSGDFKEYISFIKTIVYPSGRVILFKVHENNKKDEAVAQDYLFSMSAALKEEEIFIDTANIEAPDLLTGSTIVLQTTKGMRFPPNTLFYIMAEDEGGDRVLKDIICKAADEGLGVIVLKCHPEKKFAEEKKVNLWIRKQSPNIDLSILIALQIKKNWDGEMRLIQVVDSDDQVKDAHDYLSRMKDLARLGQVDISILVGQFRDVVTDPPQGDVNIFGMPEEPDLELIRSAFASVNTSVLFLRDSKHESLIA